jgi:hypothetical protein
MTLMKLEILLGCLRHYMKDFSECPLRYHELENELTRLIIEKKAEAQR